MRARFEPPVGDLTTVAFATLYIRAGLGDAYDRYPSEGDLTYWHGKLPEMIARGIEIGIPDYAWKRLIGWQAGGADVARYGPYANPPNPGPSGGWATPLVDVSDPVPAPGPVPVPPMPPETGDPLTAVFAALGALHEEIAVLRAVQARGLTGTLWGYTIQLRPPQNVR